MYTRPFPFPATSRRIALLTAAVALLFAAPLWADKNPEYTSLAGVKAAGFQKWLDDANDQGYDMGYINGYSVGDHVEYAGVALKLKGGKGNFECKFDLTDDDYKDYFKEMSKKGYIPTTVSGYHTKAGPRFAIAWRKNTGKADWKAKHNQSEKEYDDTVKAMRKDGYFPMRATAYQGPDGGVRYTALFIKAWEGAELEGRHGMTADEYQDQLDKWQSNGFRMHQVHVYDSPDGLRFLASAWKVKGEKVLWQEHHDMTGNQYQKQFDKLGEEGWRPHCICGYLDGGQVKFAVIWDKD